MKNEFLPILGFHCRMHFSEEKPGGAGRPFISNFHFISFQAGGNGPFMSPLPTKLLMNWEDITTDHRDVPAFETTTW